MRKLTAIFLLLIMFFNMLGCYGLFLTIWHHNEQQVLQAFDEDVYNEAEAVTIRFPHTITYVMEQPDYQRVDGEFEHEGEFYRLVKQRITSDAIIVIGVKDKKSERINKALTDYVKTFTDDHEQSKGTKKLNLNFSKDYYYLPFSIVTLSMGWESNVLQHGRLKFFSSHYLDRAIHPPEAI